MDVNDESWTSATRAQHHLDTASKASYTHGGHLQHQTEAQLGIGYALLALVDVLTPEETMLLEVAEKKLPLAVLAYVENEYNRLHPFIGHGVKLVADDPRYTGTTVVGYLTNIERFDTYVLCTVTLERSEDHVQCVSARVRPVTA